MDRRPAARAVVTNLARPQRGVVSDPADLWALEDILQFSVKPTTLACYFAVLRRHTFAGFELSEKGILAHLRGRRAESMQGLKQLVSAFRWWCATQNHLPSPRFGELNPRLLAARATLMRAVTTPRIRGAIDAPKLFALLDWMKRDPNFSTRAMRNVLIAWGFGLRACELEAIKISQLKRQVKHGVVNWFVTSPRMHVPTMQHRQNPNTPMQCVRAHPTAVRHIDDRMRAHIRADGSCNNIDSDEKLLVGWVSTAVRGWIHAAAHDLGWSSLLDWTLHGLRHGVITDLVARVGFDVTRSFGHHSPESNCIDRYGETNVSRMQRARAGGVPQAPSPDRHRAIKHMRELRQYWKRRMAVVAQRGVF